MSETSPHFYEDLERGNKAARFVIGVAEYVEEQPEYEQGTLEAYEEVFDK